MSHRVMSPRLVMFWLVAGGLLWVCTPQKLYAQIDKILDRCDGREIKASGGPVVFCRKEQMLWMEVGAAKSFSEMAMLCCNDQRAAVASFSEGLDDRPHPLKGKWYRIDWRLVKPTQLADEGGDDETGALSEETVPQEVTPTPEPIPPLPDAPLVDWKFLGLILGGVIVNAIVVTTVFFVFWAFFRKKDRKGGSEDQAELKALSVALAEPLTEAMRKALSQKIVIEIVPPLASRISEWEPLLTRVGEIVSNPASKQGTGQGSLKFNEGRGTSLSTVESAPSSYKSLPQGSSGERRYVQRETTYGAAAKNFGGDLAFQETNLERAGFYIELIDQWSGLLYPNPSAGEFDPLHENLFNLAMSDFPSKVNVNPKPVRRDGQRWVLDSQAR